MKLMTRTFVLALAASASLVSAQDPQDPQEPRDTQQPELRLPCPEWSVDACGGPHHEFGQRVRRETPRQVWDPYLAQYRPRDARKDAPAPQTKSGARHRHPGRSDWCYERH